LVFLAFCNGMIYEVSHGMTLTAHTNM